MSRLRIPFCGNFRRRDRRKLVKVIILILLSSIFVRWVILPQVYKLVLNFLYIFVLQRCANGDLLWKHMTFEYLENNTVKDTILHCIPSVPEKESSIGWHVPLLDSSLSSQYLKLPYNTIYTDKIVILSPVRDASNFLQHFGNELSKLSYPHHLISVFFGEDGSSDNTFDIARDVVFNLKNKHGFRNAAVYKLPVQGNKSTRKTRHFLSQQQERRSHLAKVRNRLTELSLTDEEWVLWIDSDVHYFRADIIQQFLHSNKDVMVASALVSKVDLASFRTFGVYDRNTRRIDTDYKTMTQYSIYLNDLKAEGREAKVDLVGACTLMIRAVCVRKGLVFPEGPYMPKGVMIAFEGLESEGLGQMAKDMGLQVYGLPFVEVYHVYDPPTKEGVLKNLLYFLYSAF